jgi:hypothetical protein
MSSYHFTFHHDERSRSPGCRCSLLIAAVAAITVLLSFTARAGSIANLTTIADTTLQSAFPGNNLGGDVAFQSGGRRQGGSARALLLFDIAGSMPSGSTINSVSLTLTVVSTPFDGVNSTFELHRIIATWGEGTGTGQGGAPAAAGDATWVHRKWPDVEWTTPGGDFDDAISALQDISGDGDYSFTSPNLVADVQSWLDNPSTNFGWLLRSQSETTPVTIRRFASRDYVGNAPVLLVDYSTPEIPPRAPTITGVSLAGNQIRFSFNAESNVSYTVEYTRDAAATNWIEITNIPATASPATVLITDPVTSSNRLYRARTP